MQNSTQDGLQKQRLLRNILNKHRLTKGWAMLPPEQADAMITAWMEVLDLERIPYTAYEAIYQKTMATISRTIADGKKVPDFDANLMASIWKGDRDLRVRFTPQSGYLIGSMAAGCSRCHGTGWEFMKETYPKEVARCRCGKIPGM
jgi:hypothetical protein